MAASAAGRTGAAMGAAGQQAYLDRLLIRVKDRIVLVRMKDVDWIEAAADYVHVHSSGKKYILRAKIGDLEKRIDPARFARIHRSTIVRIDRISELRPTYHGDYQVVLLDRTELTLSRGYKNRFSLFVQNAI
jgi:two-component system LytT family response regulator